MMWEFSEKLLQFFYYIKFKTERKIKFFSTALPIFCFPYAFFLQEIYAIQM